MRDDDTDIEELERLLGPARDAYREVRHRGALPEAAPVRRIVTPMRLAAAASLLVAVTVGALSLMPGDGARKSRLSVPDTSAAIVLSRPALPERARLTSGRLRLSARPRLPRRPALSRG